MASSRRWVLLTSSLVIALGCSSKPGEEKGDKKETERTWHSAHITLGIHGTLVPIRLERPEKADSGEAVWQGLYPGMAKGPESKKLLARLYGATTASLVVLDEQPRNSFRPGFAPSQPSEGYLGLWYYPGRVDSPGHGAEPGVKPVLWARINLASFESGPTRPQGDDIVQLVILTCNDYLLRQRKGHYLLHGSWGPTDPATEAIAKKGPEELQMDLAQQIAAFLKKKRR